MSVMPFYEGGKICCVLLFSVSWEMNKKGRKSLSSDRHNFFSKSTSSCFREEVRARQQANAAALQWRCSPLTLARH